MRSILLPVAHAQYGNPNNNFHQGQGGQFYVNQPQQFSQPQEFQNPNYYQQQGNPNYYQQQFQPPVPRYAGDALNDYQFEHQKSRQRDVNRMGVTNRNDEENLKQEEPNIEKKNALQVVNETPEEAKTRASAAAAV